MERKDLLGINGKIFTGQGRAIEKNAASDVRVLVVGNPCNTNCLIAMNNGKGVPSDRWFAMTRLEENRAKSQLAAKAHTHVSSVSNLAIWGNHSSTQYPDFYNAKINGKPAKEVIEDELWLKEPFIPIMQQRGAAIIKARGASSASRSGTFRCRNERYSPSARRTRASASKDSPVAKLARSGMDQSGSCVDDEPLLGFSRSLIDFDRTRVHQNLIQDAYLYLGRSSTFRRKKFLMRHKRSCGSIAAG